MLEHRRLPSSETPGVIEQAKLFETMGLEKI
jgi:hypothetical protein